MEFEKLLKELQQIIDKLSNENVALSESIELFSKSVEISKNCMDILNESKGKISVVKKQMDELFETTQNVFTAKDEKDGE